jgi:hypothetical protein
MDSNQTDSNVDNTKKKLVKKVTKKIVKKKTSSSLGLVEVDGEKSATNTANVTHDQIGEKEIGKNFAILMFR